ncbi:MAG: glycosyltransferase family 4 protein [Roseiflexus sp.]|uniref:glycosyltransferase family 4 protein n=1 Tax=Roseiflexus sp. TaxID=2562120 RepID=UPI0025ED8D86|nr:glycosyltransferase family 4 protein [Roseiflexus sp.]MCL6543572.1 glycosyltransferase family 4 protein [Roseiflexus sp.]
MNILLPTDVFPPRCGGAGWSAHALALALIARGHTVTAIVPREGHEGIRTGETLGVPTVFAGYRAPRIPFVRNYARNERLWPHLAQVIVETSTSPPFHHPATIIHAQHVQVAPSAVIAGRRIGAPVVISVRDHWPWDYFATGLHGDRIPYPRQTWASLATDLPARLGPLPGAVALPAIPYMLAHLAHRRAALRQASAVIAGSRYIADRLTDLVEPARLHVIPNIVDLAAIDAIIVTPPASVPPDEPFVLFVGKLERNKGAHLLNDIVRAARDALHRHTLVIAGAGPLKNGLAQAMRTAQVRARFLDWIDHDEALRLMAHCDLLLFPSAWGEPLSRVLLEACACGAPVLAMPTGGTPDIIIDGESGALAATVPAFARRLAELLERPAERCALGAGARRRAAQRFAPDVVAAQVERLYQSLGESARRAAP